jgi:hypothetical protein
MNTALNDISDSVFPDLATVFNPERMVAIAQEALAPFGSAYGILAAKVMDVNYDPGNRCNLLFQFKVRKKSGGRTRRQMVTVRLLKTGEEAPDGPGPEEIRRFEQAHAGYLPGPYVCVEEPRMVLSTFPYDPAMPWMVEGLDTTRMKHRLSRLWVPERWKAAKVKVTLLGYTPHMRASMHYDVRRLHCETGERDKVELIGKTNAYKKTGKLFADSLALWETSGRSFPMPRPVGYLSAPRLTLQERVAGRRLGSLVEAPGFRDRVVETAEALALLHSLRFPVNARRRARDEVKSLRRWGEVVGGIRSDLRSRVSPLLAQMVRDIESRTEARCAIHADFHHTNVLVDGDRIHVIDFDEMAYGDPSVDVGRFLASLRIPTLRAFGNIHQLDDVREQFLEAYLEKIPGEVSRIRLFEAASLVTSAASAFRIQRPNWNTEVSLLLDEAERVFAEARRPTPVAGGGDLEPNLSWKERIRWAGDPAYVQAMVDRPILNAHGVDLDGCEALRVVESPKAFSARFKLAGSRAGERWRSHIRVAVSRRKGGFTTYRLLEESYPLVAQHPEMLRPPRPLMYLTRLSASVTESCAGVGLHAFNDRDEIVDAMGRIGRALAAWHAATAVDSADDLEKGHRRPFRRIYRKPVDERFASVVAKAESLLSESVDCSLRLLHHVRLHDVVVNADHVGLTGVAAVYYADSRHDVASIVAAWRVRGLVPDEADLCAAAVSAFVQAYEERSGAPLVGFAPFETLALAERAHHLSGQTADKERLLAMAEARLEVIQ